MDPIIDELRAFQADHVWIDQNKESLLKEYNEQWIAVRDLQVIASDPSFDGLLAKLHDRSRICVEFMTREPLEMIL